MTCALTYSGKVTWKYLDISRQRFGNLVAIRPIGRRGPYTVWECRCNCGEFTNVPVNSLRSGGTRSCGCLKRRHPSNFLDLAGRRFGRLSVLQVGPSVGRRAIWVCRCDCDGKTVNVSSSHLLIGHTKSCGCFRSVATTMAKTTHGGTVGGQSRLYMVWSAMKRRCQNPKARGYADYGGRGIRVCARWLGPNGFANFRADMGPRPSRLHSIDRIDNDGPYSPKNCRWATMTEQAQNRRSVRFYIWRGERLCLADWQRRFGVFPTTIHDLLSRDIPFAVIARLLSKPKK